MKTCGKCKWFSYTWGDIDAKDYPDGGDFGYCLCPLPISVDDIGNSEVYVDDKASDCYFYKKKKDE
jgi:hypothetical protein